MPGCAAHERLNFPAQPGKLLHALDVVPEKDDVSDFIFPHHSGEVRRNARTGKAEYEPLTDLSAKIHRRFLLQ